MKDIVIETERLRIHVASREQMEQFIKSQVIDDLKLAYTEMLNGCSDHPDQWEWYAIWMIGLNVGELCFKGLDPNGIAEIGYGISEKYRNNGYAAEAVKAVSEWALTRPEVNALESETDPDNKASQRVLEKCGFVRVGEEKPVNEKMTLIDYELRK